ncbi:MAG: hypothetical protein EPO68_00550 [Planctomycetota bacterium]|nr:MAG: hypothetical protein EPO68_00550 [Planctomycetota bacterium]
MADDWRKAELSSRERALCAFAERLTRAPGRMDRGALDELRAQGLDDVALHEAAQIVAYFNYINRVADALHVDLEPDMPGYPPPG